MDKETRSWEKVLRAIDSGQPLPEEWHALTPDEQELIEGLQKDKLMANAIAFLDHVDEEQAWSGLSEKIGRSRPARITAIRFLRYAAVLAGLVMLGATTFLLLQKNNSPRPVVAGKYITAPANPKRATLELADGRHIELDKTPDSRIRQGQAEITNIDTALLRYTATAEAILPAGFNTLTIPRGGKYKIELADGSEIWLNAETQLRYPAHFGGVTKREVYLEKGEAYFKIKKNAEQPFLVHSGGMEIQVLGTEFNVNTYTKNYATTLVNGSVRLNAGAAVAMLQPGQQSLYTEKGFTRTAVDVDTYTAWKDDQIVFEETPLEEVMINLGRLYDFAVEFTSPQLKERKFGGRLKRTQHIEDVLTIIEQTGYVKFSIRGKTIFASPGLSK